MSEHSGAPRSRGRHRARLMRERRGVNRLLLAGVLALAGLVLVLLGAGPASGHIAGQVAAGQAVGHQAHYREDGVSHDHGCDDTRRMALHHYSDRQRERCPGVRSKSLGRTASPPRCTGEVHRQDGSLLDHLNLDSTVARATATIYSGWSWRVRPEPWPVRYAKQFVGATEQLVGSADFEAARRQFVGSAEQLVRSGKPAPRLRRAARRQRKARRRLHRAARRLRRAPPRRRRVARRRPRRPPSRHEHVAVRSGTGPDR